MHSGHIYQIEETRKKGATHIVCVMSGNYVQRGECAFFDKWTRADIAVNSGADLVVELPTVWSCADAPDFAYAAISILSNLKIDMLSFGSETDDISLLKKCVDADEKELSAVIKDYIKKGYSYPYSLNKAVELLYGKETASVLASPNSTLAVEYIKAMKRLSLNCQLYAVKRVGACHDDVNVSDKFASASALRNLSSLNEMKPYISAYSFEKLENLYEKGYLPAVIKMCERAILSSIRKMDLEELKKYADNSRGLAERIYLSSRKSESLDELYENIKTKNLTLSKVRRSVLRCYLEIPLSFSKEKPPYIKVLAANEKGIEVIKNANSALNVVTKHSDTANLSPFGKSVYEIECKCSDLYALFSKKIRACGLEQTSSAKFFK